MDGESTLNENNQLDSTSCTADNPNVSFSNTSSSTEGTVGVNLTSKLLEGALFIVSNGTYQNEDIPVNWQHRVELLERIFNRVSLLNNRAEEFSLALIGAYADLYAIDLHLIVWADNKYTNEVFAWRSFESFVNQVNQQLTTTDQDQVQQDLNAPTDELSHMAVDNASNSSNVSQSGILPRAPDFIKQTLLQINQLLDSLQPHLNTISLDNRVFDLLNKNIDRSSLQDVVELIQQRLMLISEVVQIVVESTKRNQDTTICTNILAESSNNSVQLDETDDPVEMDQHRGDVQPFPPTHLLNTTEAAENTTADTPAQLPYDPPTILIQPKPEWHYRCMKDLRKKRIPLLAGEGPQRTLIRVRIPPQGAQQMYLGVKTRTNDNREHCLKILVPEKTNVNMESFSNDNNFERLQLDQCNPTDWFDPVHRCVYSLISPVEHLTQEKNVRIHMFNLYQSGLITRKLIAAEQLYQCRLAFWFCVLEDGVYRPVSTSSSSALIRED